MSSIYRSSPAKKSKSGGGASVVVGGGSQVDDSEARLSVVGGEGNQDGPCPTKGCEGHILAKKRRNSQSFYGICDRRRTDGEGRCPLFFIINKPHWGSGPNPRTCEWCEEDTAGSPSMGVASDGAGADNKQGESGLCVELERPLCLEMQGFVLLFFRRQQSVLDAGCERLIGMCVTTLSGLMYLHVDRLWQLQVGALPCAGGTGCRAVRHLLYSLQMKCT